MSDRFLVNRTIMLKKLRKKNQQNLIFITSLIFLLGDKYMPYLQNDAPENYINAVMFNVSFKI